MTPTLDLKALRELALKAISTERAADAEYQACGYSANYQSACSAYATAASDLHDALDPQTVSALLDELVALRDENERLRERGIAITADEQCHLCAYAEIFGAFHDDDCPEDDNCECSYRPMLEAVNAICSRKALTPHSDRSEG